jgi:hypothetical protein
LCDLCQEILADDAAMKDNAVHQGMRTYLSGRWLVALWAGTALLLAGLVESAPAAKMVGRDGKVYACYKGKGKQKGKMRLVAKRGKCRRGERKISWAARGPAGPQGSVGANGAVGPAGPPASSALEAKVTELTTRVEALEGVLEGVTNEALTDALANVNALCTQASALTDQVNAVGTALEDTALGGIIPLGLELLVPGLPSELPDFNCPG